MPGNEGCHVYRTDRGDCSVSIYVKNNIIFRPIDKFMYATNALEFNVVRLILNS